MIVETLHILTITWAFSRSFAPRDAWKPNRLDYPTGGIAALSWLAITLDWTTDVASGRDSLGEPSALEWFVAIVVVAGVYVGLTYLWYRVRVWVGGSDE